MSYYDIDTILTDAQKIPCTFTLDVPLLGYLDGTPTNQTHNAPLKASTRIDLPLWLAEMLAVSSTSITIPSSPTPQPLVTLDLPASLSPRVIHALKASPQSVDLRAQAPHFFGLGARLLELFEEEEILDVLVEAFRKRAVAIADHAANVGGGAAAARSGGVGVGMATDGVEFLRGLDELERGLFRVAHDSAKDVRVWMRRSSGN